MSARLLTKVSHDIRIGTFHNAVVAIRKHNYAKSGKDFQAKFKFEKVLLQTPLCGGSVSIIIVVLPSRERGMQPKLYVSAHVVIAKVKASSVVRVLCLVEP